MKKIRLLHDKLLILRDSHESKTTGGIFLPDTSQKKEIGMGTVVQGTPELPQGTRIVFSKYAGTDISLEENKEHVALDEKDIMAKYD